MAPKGNKNGLKLKSPDIRQIAYKQYCAHIAKGFSKDSFTFRHEKLTCTFRTLEKYIADNPTEFPPILKELAQADSLKLFEIEGFKLMRGEYKSGSPETWKTIMRNKFGWDRQDVEEVAECAADIILRTIRGA